MSPIAKPPAKPVAAKPAARSAPAPAAARPAPPTRPGSKIAAAPPAPAPAASGFMSFNPDTFTSGGLIDDMDVDITDVLCVDWDYNGNAPLGPALAIEFTDPNGATHTQYYSAGKAEDWKASEDGEHFEPVSGKTGLNMTTNLGMFINSLVTAGFPKEWLTDSLKVLIGTKCHVLQQVTERKGLIRTGPNATRPTSVLLVSKIIQLPGGEEVETAEAHTVAPVKTAHGANGKDLSKQPLGKPVSAPVPAQAAPVQAPAQAPAKTPAKAAPKTTAAAVAEVADDLDQTIIEALSEVLAEEPYTIDKKDISKVVFKRFTDLGKSATERNKAVVRSGQQDFLKGLAELGIAYDGAQIMLATE